MRPSECDACGRKHHAVRGRYQQCPECDRRYCLDCMNGGGVVTFGECPRCPDNPVLKLEERENKPVDTLKP